MKSAFFSANTIPFAVAAATVPTVNKGRRKKSDESVDFGYFIVLREILFDLNEYQGPADSHIMACVLVLMERLKTNCIV